MAFFCINSFAKALNTFALNEVRTYARWSHRKPMRILTTEECNTTGTHQALAVKPEEIIQKHLNVQTEKRIDNQTKTKINKKNRMPQKITSASKNVADTSEIVTDAEGNFVYSKLKDNDPTISKLLLTVKSHKHQVKQDLALLEGKRLIKEALQTKCQLKYLIFSRKTDVEDLKSYLPKTGARLLKMPYREIQMWSDLSTTPGIIGLFKTPEVESFISNTSLPITLICDNIREPGNLGAILRTAAGVGVERVVLTKGCVNLWETKVLRSACGAHFHLRIHKGFDWTEVERLLNELKSIVLIADNRVISKSTSNEETTDIVSTIPLLPYYGVRFGDYKSLTLVIGGETEGISEESFRLASNFGGVRLNIPMNDCVESLNVGTALGVILFEIKRQLSKCK